MSINQAELNALLRIYTRGVNRDLAKHQLADLFGRNVLAAHDAMFEQAELELNKLGYLHELSTALVSAALKHNRSSCALSNFPQEHHPSPDYVQNVLIQVEQLFTALEKGLQ